MYNISLSIYLLRKYSVISSSVDTISIARITGRMSEPSISLPVNSGSSVLDSKGSRVRPVRVRVDTWPVTTWVPKQ